jgi:TolB-like protein/Tfp pilus assembly protein PilF
MASNSNKLSQFWKEVKRRKVLRIIAVYAGVAYVIFEASTLIFPRWGLPDWTIDLVLYLLIFGAIITVIVSWIYDIHPEGGIVKTESVNKITMQDIPKFSNSQEIQDKSVAVLPFINDSPDKDNEHIINGIMEDLVINLQSIKDLRVPGRTSTEQYRNNPKPIPEITHEMNVAYIVEGSGQRYGDKIRLRVQLVEGFTDRHIWANSYDKVINGPEDIFRIQSEIAQSIAAELQAVITPEEEQIILKVPTTSLMANELYHRGRDEFISFLLNTYDRDALQRAHEYYLKSLEYDSTFSKACAGVAVTLHCRLTVRGPYYPLYSEGYLENNAFEKVFHWANNALLIDKQLPEAYYIRGSYFYETGHREKAEQDYRKAIQLNPNYWEAYYGLGNLYTGFDYTKVFENFQRAADLVRGPEFSYMSAMIIQTYLFVGLHEQAESLIADFSSLIQDSLTSFMTNWWIEFIKGNLDKQHYWLSKAHAYDSANPTVLSWLAETYVRLGNIEEGLKYYKQSIDSNEAHGRIFINMLHRIGYVYSLTGHIEEADYYFDRAEEICKSLIRLNRPMAQYGNAQYDLALIYAFRGEKSEAMEILRSLHQRSHISLVIAFYIQWDPMLDGIRDDAEFQQIANDIIMRAQTDQERIRQWLEENDIL